MHPSLSEPFAGGRRHIKPFVDQWPYFYERCIGRIGVLKDWLVRALAATIAAGQNQLYFERIQECALPIAQCESMALEAAAGEQELHYTASRQQHLWALLVQVQEATCASDSGNCASPGSE
jgi:hypothetical protein